ncbi:MAG: relaxase/mobilization nuclease domain-containing protein [Planctomycetaceae bacterium]|nr:relaxase/mobilization nuclease domain-containing protein [Planctomycetaceae bacterium]
MIAKRINFRETSKSNIVRLVDYITADQEKECRVGDIMLANCRHVPELAAREMAITQAMNKRSTVDKTYHLLVSFRAGEEPSPETLRRVEAALCAKLGFSEHQRIAVVHRDTDNTHMHIAINKVHSTHFTVRSPRRDFKALAEGCAELEKSLVLRPDNHQPTGKTKGERQAGDMEAMTGQESLLGWIRRECLDGMKAAASWEALYSELAKAGLALALRGNGMVITDQAGNRVKASDADRSFSKANLEKRFGPFQAPPTNLPPPVKRYEKKPLGPDNPLKDEFARMKAVQDTARQTLLAAIRDEYRRRAAAIRSEYRLERKQARHLPAGRAAKRKLYRALATKQRQRLEELRRETAAKRQPVHRDHPRRNWLSWLQAEATAGREEAIQALRKRAFGLARKIGPAIRGDCRDGANSLAGPNVDTVTKRGTVIYRVEVDRLRDDGESFRLSKDGSLDTAVMALKLARRRFGDVLRLDGDHAFRDRMVMAAVEGNVSVRFADTLLEEKRKQLTVAVRHNSRLDANRSAPSRT